MKHQSILVAGVLSFASLASLAAADGGGHAGRVTLPTADGAGAPAMEARRVSSVQRPPLDGAGPTVEKTGAAICLR